MDLLFKTIPAVARELSGKSTGLCIKLTLQLWFFAVSRKLKLSDKDFTLKGTLNNNSIVFYLRHVMDIAVLREVFVDKEYEWCPTSDLKVIIDLGAHFGDTTLYYAARFPEAKIVAVEPSPENFARLVQHTKHNPNIIPVQAAIGPEDGEITLHLMPSSLGHSIVDRKGSGEEVVVQQLSLQSLFQKNNITKADLIKFDIEGAEFDLFKSFNPKEYSNSYIGEVHYDLTSDTNINFDDFFSGFHLEKIMLQNDKRFLVMVS